MVVEILKQNTRPRRQTRTRRVERWNRAKTVVSRGGPLTPEAVAFKAAKHGAQAGRESGQLR